MPTRHGLTGRLPVAPHRLSRRSFLRIGALGLGGLTLSGLLRSEAVAGIRSSHKSVTACAACAIAVLSSSCLLRAAPTIFRKPEYALLDGSALLYYVAR